MNCASYHPSKHQPVNDCRGVGAASSTAPQTPASVEALEAKISSLKMLRVRDSFDQRSPPVSHSNSTAAVADGSKMQILHIPTKSENCEPGPTLNPASCASGLALIGGGVGVGDGNIIMNNSSYHPSKHLSGNDRLALIGGFGDGNDWISDLSLTALVERVNADRGSTRRRNSTLHNEDWDWDELPSSQGNRFLGNR
eukprot:scaffold4123_cov145-Skeletonema_menzelii.AAC.8